MRTAALILLLATAACGGGGGSTSTTPPLTPHATAGNATLALSLTIPSPTLQVHARSPKYISPFTKGLGITLTPSGSATPIPDTTPTVAIDLSNQSLSSPPIGGSLGPNGQTISCTPAPNGRNCTITLSIVPGTYSASIVAWDQAPAISATAPPTFSNLANPLSELTQSIAASATTPATLDLVLNGVVAKVSLSPLPGQAHLLNISQAAYTIIGNGPVLFNAVALDAAGNEIIGDGAPTITLTGSSALAIASPSPASSPAPPTFGAGVWTVRATSYASSGTALTATAVPPTGAPQSVTAAITTQEELWLVDGGSGAYGSTGRQPQGAILPVTISGYAISPSIGTPTQILVDSYAIASAPSICGLSGYSAAATGQIALDPITGELWIAQNATASASTHYCIQAYDLQPYSQAPTPSTTNVVALYNATLPPTGQPATPQVGAIAFDSSGNLWGVENTTGDILTYNVGAGPQTYAAAATTGVPNTPAGAAYHLAFSPSTAANFPNSLYVGDDQVGASFTTFQIARYAVSGTTLGAPTTATVGSPMTNGGEWVGFPPVAVDSNGEVYSVDPSSTTGATALIGLTPTLTGFNPPFASASFGSGGASAFPSFFEVAPDGNLWTLYEPTNGSVGATLAAYALGSGTITAPSPTLAMTPGTSFTIAP